jgi:T4 RnlA family RNA ligase
MKTLEFLNSFPTMDSALASIKEKLGITARVYQEDGYAIVLLDYDQINSPKVDQIVIECRSLILSYTNKFEVLSRKFDRFFNYGEALDYYKDFRIEESIVYEKLDGSLIGVWFNKFTKRWEISTRGMAFAEGNHPIGGTFREKVLAAFNTTDEQLQEVFNKKFQTDWTIIFEYIGPENKVVTRYSESQMVILGSRRNDGTEFVDLDHLQEKLASLNVRTARTYFGSDIEKMRELANSLPNLEEGFVIHHPATSKRMKLKSETYVLAHRIRGNDMVPTRKNLLELVLTGETDEFLGYFPEWTESVKSLENEVETFLNNAQSAYDEFKHIEDQKEFALQVKSVPGNQFIFRARKSGSDSIRKTFYSDGVMPSTRLKCFE